MHDHQIIQIADVPVTAQVGVSAGERAHAQPLSISVALTLFDPPCYPDHDQIQATVDYDAVIAFLREGLQAEGPAQLIETLADRVARHCLGLNARIACADVTIVKPAVLGAAGRVSVSMRRYADRATHRHALFLAEEARRAEHAR